LTPFSEKIFSIEFDYVDGFIEPHQLIGAIVENNLKVIFTVTDSSKAKIYIKELSQRGLFYFILVANFRNDSNIGNAVEISDIQTNINDFDFARLEGLFLKEMIGDVAPKDVHEKLKSLAKYHITNYRLNKILQISKINKPKILVLYSHFSTSGILNKALYECDSHIAIFVESGISQSKDAIFGLNDLSFFLAVHKTINPDFVLSVNGCGFSNISGVFHTELAKIVANLDSKVVFYAIDKMDFIAEKIVDKQNTYFVMNRTDDVKNYKEKGFKAFYQEWANPVYSDDKTAIKEPLKKILFIGNNIPLHEAKDGVKAFEAKLGKERLQTFIDEYLFKYTSQTVSAIKNLECDFGIVGFGERFGELQRSSLIYELAKLGAPLDIYGAEERYRELADQKAYKKFLNDSQERASIINETLLSLDFLRIGNIDSINDRIQIIIDAGSLPLMCGYSKLNPKNIFTEECLFYESPQDLLEKFEYLSENLDFRRELIEKYKSVLKDRYNPDTILRNIIENVSQGQ